MYQEVLKLLSVTYRKIVSSIAFLPAIIAILFLAASFGMISFDFSPTGKAIKSNLHWLSLKDASTARSICSAIAGGILSLAVFSFSMVMILLNQAASQMSNRVLGNLIGNRFQQTVLGFYIGTIVYALFLLSTIRDVNSGIYVPAISTYLLIALSIADIFLFIYFLHYITESIKFETIILRIYNHTKKEMEKKCTSKPDDTGFEISGAIEIGAFQSGIYQGFEKKSLLSYCEKTDALLSVLQPAGTYLMEGAPLLKVWYKKQMTKEFKEELRVLVNIHSGQEIGTHYYYGFNQLMEIAVKALSPGINDPGTAIISLHCLGDLLAYLLTHFPYTHLKDGQEKLRVIIKERTVEQMFSETILPIWDYGKDDRLVQLEMLKITTQLLAIKKVPIIEKLAASVQLAIANKAQFF